MTPQEKMIEYAKKNNDQKVYTHEQFIGKMIAEGIVINRTPTSMTVANAKREGLTITITETVQKETANPGEIIEETTTVMTIEL